MNGQLESRVDVFRVNQMSGEIQTTNILDRETQAVYDLTVSMVDVACVYRMCLHMVQVYFACMRTYVCTVLMHCHICAQWSWSLSHLCTMELVVVTFVHNGVGRVCVVCVCVHMHGVSLFVSQFLVGMNAGGCHRWWY